MRHLLILTCLLLASSSFAQEPRIFRASPVDVEQDNRISTVEKQIGELTRLVKSLAEVDETLIAKATNEPTLAPAPKPDSAPDALSSVLEKSNDEPRYCVGDVRYCEGRLHYLGCVDGEEKWLPVPLSTQVVQLATNPIVVTASATKTVVQRAVVSSRYTIGELRSIIRVKRPGGWRGAVYADVQPVSWAYRHLVSDHGFTSDQVNGLSIEEARILHDLAHGRQVSAHRSSGSYVQQSTAPEPTQYPPSLPVVQQTINIQRAIPTPIRSTIQAFGAGCPNGRCPTYQPSTRGLFRRF